MVATMLSYAFAVCMTGSLTIPPLVAFLRSHGMV